NLSNFFFNQSNSFFENWDCLGTPSSVNDFTPFENKGTLFSDHETTNDAGFKTSFQYLTDSPK
ncbi:26737_t:CDS:1, partial [Gigaspora margarita]